MEGLKIDKTSLANSDEKNEELNRNKEWKLRSGKIKKDNNDIEDVSRNEIKNRAEIDKLLNQLAFFVYLPKDISGGQIQIFF